MLIASQLQAAVINKMLPKGFRFELYETVKRQADQANNVRDPLKRRKVNNNKIVEYVLG